MKGSLKILGLESPESLSKPSASPSGSSYASPTTISRAQSSHCISSEQVGAGRRQGASTE